MDRLKSRIAMLTLLSMLCVLLCGCGGKDAGTGAPAMVTPRVLNADAAEPDTPEPNTPAPTSVPAPAPTTSPTTAPAAGPTPAPTGAPASEPVKTWFEKSGLTFTEQGEFKFHTDLSNVSAGAANEELEAEFAVDPAETAAGADRKIIQATLQITPTVFTAEDNHKTMAWSAMYGFLDQYTGRMIVCEIEDGEHVDTTIEFGGKRYDITLAFAMASTGSLVDLGYSSTLLPAQLIFTLTCPEDYDGAAFFACGCSSDDFDIYVADPIGHFDTFDNSGYDFYVFDGSN